MDRELMELLEGRRQECAAILERLLDTAACAYEYDQICSTVPKASGIYLFSQKGAPKGEYLYGGKSKNLCSRVGDQHWNLQENCDLVKMVMKAYRFDRDQARIWVRENCAVQWVEVIDDRIRAFAEDYMISVLRPKWNHKMSFAK